jgi:hypothetical protein
MGKYGADGNDPFSGHEDLLAPTSGSEAREEEKGIYRSAEALCHPKS